MLYEVLPAVQVPVGLLFADAAEFPGGHRMAAEHVDQIRCGIPAFRMYFRWPLFFSHYTAPEESGQSLFPGAI